MPNDKSLDRVAGLQRLARHAHTLDELAKLARACQRGLAGMPNDLSGLELTTTVCATFANMPVAERASFAADLQQLDVFVRMLMLVAGYALIEQDGQDFTYTRWSFPLDS